MENKITEEELKTIQTQGQDQNKLLSDIGVLSAQKHSLLHDLAGLNVKIEKNKEALNEKYGSININIEDGSYKVIEEDKKDE